MCVGNKLVCVGGGVSSGKCAICIWILRRTPLPLHLPPPSVPNDTVSLSRRIAFVLLPLLKHASVLVLAMFHANCHMAPWCNVKGTDRKEREKRRGEKFMTRSRAKQRKMLTISAPINRLVHMNIYALSATPFKQGLQAPQKAPLHPPHISRSHATGQGEQDTVRRTCK